MTVRAGRERPGPRVPVRWPAVFAIAAGAVTLLAAVAGRHGYNVDELYFRLLGERGPAWGYVDQPPLLPLLTRACVEVFGDTLWAIRLPAALCAGGVIVLGAMLAAELGGRPRAQLLAALGLATSSLVLGVGHILVTATLDLLAWTAVLLFAARALLRGNGRWWLAVGTVCGLAVYAKYLVVLLPLALLVALAVVGPRAALRDRWLAAGAGLALLIGLPNVVYQVLHSFPQLQMARALGGTDGLLNRVVFLPGLVLLLGLALTPIWVSGLLGLLREPAWRPVRALAAAYLLGTVLVLAAGGRPDYTGGFLIALFAAGCVRADRWLARGGWRMPVLAAALTLGAAAQILVALPVLPQRSLARFAPNDITLESVGWPALARQVAAVYRGLPEADRARAVVLANNLGEAGALDRYGPPEGLPAVFSGHNELYRWGPPPETAQVVIAVGVGEERLRADFASCQVVARLDNGLAVANAEQGQPVTVCRTPRAAWSTLWPAYHYLSG